MLKTNKWKCVHAVCLMAGFNFFSHGSQVRSLSLACRRHAGPLTWTVFTSQDLFPTYLKVRKLALHPAFRALPPDRSSSPSPPPLPSRLPRASLRTPPRSSQSLETAAPSQEALWRATRASTWAVGCEKPSLDPSDAQEGALTPRNLDPVLQHDHLLRPLGRVLHPALDPAQQVWRACRGRLLCPVRRAGCLGCCESTLLASRFIR